MFRIEISTALEEESNARININILRFLRDIKTLFCQTFIVYRYALPRFSERPHTFPDFAMQITKSANRLPRVRTHSGELDRMYARQLEPPQTIASLSEYFARVAPLKFLTFNECSMVSDATHE